MRKNRVGVSRNQLCDDIDMSAVDCQEQRGWTIIIGNGEM
jgi:hypothetical protein